MIAWIAVVITLVGLRMQSRAPYVALAADDDFASSKPQRRSATDDSPTSSSSASSAAATSLELVKSAFDKTFRRAGTRSASPLKQLLLTPRPHFRTLRSIIPQYYNGYTESGHVVM